jgi:DNA processing protein
MSFISDNTRAWLLLTAPLIVADENDVNARTLSLKEANKLAEWLKQVEAEPLSLLGPNRAELFQKLSPLLSSDRLENLLNRGLQMNQALEKWNSRAIWIMSRDDAGYPTRLITKLAEQAPPLIYGAGDKGLLEQGGLAVVGSRNADEESMNFTKSIGELAATAGVNIVSGGAKGIDRAAMEACLSSGGMAVGVLSEQLYRMAAAPDCREWIRDGRLTLISLVDPAAGFNVGNAMQRNKVVYALSDTALVVSSDVNKGGTWAGAIEQLERFKSGTLYVRTSAGAPDGNTELQKRGAHASPQPETAEELRHVLSKPQQETKVANAEPQLPLFA